MCWLCGRQYVLIVPASGCMVMTAGCIPLSHFSKGCGKRNGSCVLVDSRWLLLDNALSRHSPTLRRKRKNQMISGIVLDARRLQVMIQRNPMYRISWHVAVDGS